MYPVGAMCCSVQTVATKTDLDTDINQSNKLHHTWNSLVRKQMPNHGQIRIGDSQVNTFPDG